MGRLQITRQDARIEIISRRARINIQSSRPEMKVVRGSRARMMVQRTAPRLRVNWEKMRRVPYLQRMETHMQAVNPYKVDIASDNPYIRDAEGRIRSGYNLATMQSRTDMLRQAARMHASPQRVVSTASSIVEWDSGQVDINWEIDRMQMEWVIHRPRVEVEPYAVEIRMRNYPKIQITYNPDRVTRHLGRKLDRKI